MTCEDMIGVIQSFLRDKETDLERDIRLAEDNIKEPSIPLEDMRAELNYLNRVSNLVNTYRYNWISDCLMRVTEREHYEEAGLGH